MVYTTNGHDGEILYVTIDPAGLRNNTAMVTTNGGSRPARIFYDSVGSPGHVIVNGRKISLNEVVGAYNLGRS